MLAISMGPPRCGTTLVYNIARLVVEHTGRGFGHLGQEVNFEDEAERYTGYGDPPVGIYHDLENSDFAFSDKTFVMQFHDPYQRFTSSREFFRLADEGLLKVLYAVRDLRASIESHMRCFRVSFDQAVGFLLGNSYPAWTDIRFRLDEGWILKITYPTLVSDLPLVVSQIADFLGVGISPEVHSQIVSVCLPGNAWMRRTLSREWPLLDRQEHISEKSVSSQYFRSDRWIEALTPSEISHIDTLGGGWNRELGFG